MVTQDVMYGMLELFIPLLGGKAFSPAAGDLFFVGTNTDVDMRRACILQR